VKLERVFILAILAIGISIAKADYYPPGVPVGASWVELVECSFISSGPEAGNYEYIYDVWGGSNSWLRYITLVFEDSDLTVNVWDGTRLRQNWTAMSAGVGGLLHASGYTYPEIWPSNWEDTDGDAVADAWVPTTNDWAMLNRWHDGTEYTIGEHIWTRGQVIEYGIVWENTNSFWWAGWMAEGLSNTFRIVHPYGPGMITYITSQGGSTGQIIGPVPEPATLSLLALGGLAVLRHRRG